jgi:transcriptional regulator with XRE-family HTH domain
MRDTVTAAYDNELLVQAKTEAEKTDQDIADDADVSRPTVAAILRGDTNVRLESIRAVARVLNVPLRRLFEKAA